MIKKRQDLTPAEKQRLFEATKADMEQNYHIPWPVMEQKIQSFLDQAFDEDACLQMSQDDQIDAYHVRKAFNRKKPSVVDYLIWAGTFVTKSEYVQIPD